MKLTIEKLEREAIEIEWFDVKDEGGLSFQGGRTLAD